MEWYWSHARCRVIERIITWLCSIQVSSFIRLPHGDGSFITDKPNWHKSYQSMVIYTIPPMWNWWNCRRGWVKYSTKVLIWTTCQSHCLCVKCVVEHVRSIIYPRTIYWDTIYTLGLLTRLYEILSTEKQHRLLISHYWHCTYLLNTGCFHYFVILQRMIIYTKYLITVKIDSWCMLGYGTTPSHTTIVWEPTGLF